MFGNWSTTYRRFRDWREADVFKQCVAMVESRVFTLLRDNAELEAAELAACEK